VLVGEMRDLETIETALKIADTAHLVFATLHTNSSYEAVSRIVDVFPPEQQRQVQVQIAFSLVGVMTQQLIPKSHGPGRVMCTEVLVCTPRFAPSSRGQDAPDLQPHAGRTEARQPDDESGAAPGRAGSAPDPRGRDGTRDGPLELEGMLRKTSAKAA
jgi:hypothetical protein